MSYWLILECIWRERAHKKHLAHRPSAASRCYMVRPLEGSVSRWPGTEYALLFYVCVHGRRHNITWGGHVPLTLKKSRLDPPTFAIKILVHDWSTSPAFFPLLHNQIRSTLSVEGIPIAIEIHSAFSWFPTHHAPDSTPILFDWSVALAVPQTSQSCPSLPFSGQSTLLRHSLAIALSHKDLSANIMIILAR